MDSKMKLLLVLDPTSSFYPLATERLLNEVTVMMDKKWKVHLTSQAILNANLACDYEVHKVPLISSLNSIISRALFLISSAYKGVKIVKKHNIHAILTINGHLHLGFVAYLIKKITKRKCIVRVNENDILALTLLIKRLHTPILSNEVILRMVEVISRKIENFIFGHVDWIVTHGPMDYEKIKKITTKATLIPLWIDAEKFKPLPKDQTSQLKKELIGVSDDTKVILSVGRLHPTKDIETLFNALKELVEVRKNTMLVMIGTGPDKEKCVKLAKKLSIIDKVKFLGYIPHEQMPKYYNVADVYVLTSIWEEWSNTIMEAMASGVLVIATNVGGNP